MDESIKKSEKPTFRLPVGENSTGSSSNMKTILVVEDNAVNRGILAKILSTEYQVLQAANGLEAFDLLRTQEHEIAAVILDLFMPIMDGYAFLRAVYEKGAHPNLPVIVTTGQGSEDEETKVLEMGAWDFVSKPYSARILKFRLHNAIVRSQLSAFQQLKYLAEYDTLTGLYNKNKFFTDTKVMLSSHPNNQYAFMRLDIDRFQMINSFFGNEEGDRLLRYLALELKKMMASFSPCTYGRMEADVFACCVSYTSKDQLYEMLEKTKHTIRTYNRTFDIVPSFGIYYLDDLSLPISLLLDRATLAAKTRKGSYIDVVGIYQPEMSQSIVQEQEIINEMAAALASNQFVVYIQPKYSLVSNMPIGGEALVRWRRPLKGMFSPGVFIPVFEKNGFISELDYYVWEQVCGMLRKWIDAGENPNPISVNVSRVNLYNPLIVEKICNLIDKYQLSPNLLELEMTESAYTDNPQVMKLVVRELREKGFTVLMDDFGTGYSSLSILKDIEVDALKIDMGFLENSEIAGRGENIIASMVRMAKWLNVPTIAEGAETAEQVEFLRSIGCEYVQGYFFAKPMPVDEYEQLAKSKAVSTDPHRAEIVDLDSLWSSNPQMEILFSNATHATCLYEVDDEQIEVLRANKTFFNLFGMEHYQVKESVLPEYMTEVDAAFRKCIDIEGFAECSFRRTAIGKKALWVTLKLQYICCIGKKHILFGTLFDIDAQKHVEEELRKYRSAATMKDSHATNRLLIVDDSSVNRNTLRAIFSSRFTVLEAEDGKQAITVLQEHHNRVDLILLDLIMPEMDGIAFLEYRNLSDELRDIPVIMMTSSAAPETQLQTLAMGVSDFIVKPYVPEVLLRRTENVLASSNRVRDYETVLEQAQTDPLTKLCNRTCAERRISSSLALQAGRLHALLLLDIDDFRAANETYGHLFGDALLVKLSQLLRQYFRKSDILARFGGDEFCIFLENVPSEQFVLNKCLKFCRRYHNIDSGEEDFQSSCSIGVAITNADAHSFETLYKNADLALYDSKKAGKNTVSIYGRNNTRLPGAEHLINKEWLIDALDDAILLIDNQTYEVLYMSKAGSRVCGTQSYSGKKCYEVLHGFAEPCPFCIRDKLSYENFYEFSCHLPHLSKTVLSKNRFIDYNGRKTHLHLIQDVSHLVPVQVVAEEDTDKSPSPPVLN